LIVLIVRQQKQHNNSTYRHLNRLLKRRRLSRDENLPTNQSFDIIYHHTNGILDPIPTRTARATKV
jgi:hypothetical protein